MKDDLVVIGLGAFLVLGGIAIAATEIHHDVEEIEPVKSTLKPTPPQSPRLQECIVQADPNLTIIDKKRAKRSSKLQRYPIPARTRTFNGSRMIIV